RVVAALQDEAMVAALFHGAHVDLVFGLVGDLQPERVDIKGARCREIGDAEHDMTQPHDVERRVEHGCRYRHVSSGRYAPIRAIEWLSKATATFFVSM